VFAREDELRVSEEDGGELVGELVWREVAEARMAVHALEGGGMARGARAEEFFGLLFILGQIRTAGVGAVGDLRVGHTKLLSCGAWGVRMQSG
jgi:hypothetical protein